MMSYIKKKVILIKKKKKLVIGISGFRLFSRQGTFPSSIVFLFIPDGNLLGLWPSGSRLKLSKLEFRREKLDSLKFLNH
jgi:hypothetical protein